jgi:gliding motility-associated-like protein
MSGISNYTKRFNYFTICITLLLSSFQLQAQLSADFSASPINGCAPLTVNFTDLSTGNPTLWNWNFGNGNTSNTQNPKAIYSIAGQYTVTLSLSNGSVKKETITVYSTPDAGFTLNKDTSCVGKTVNYTDASTVSPGGAAISVWEWDFGDGNTDTAKTVSHSYSTPGTYAISLIVIDLHNCPSKPKIEDVVVIPFPSPSFTASPVFKCAPPLNVNFTNTSVFVGTTTYTWHFGDGSNSTQANPSHTYTASGSYNVTLIVNQNGCIDSVVIPNMVNIQNMQAGFTATPTVVCSGQSVTFSNTSSPNAITSDWNFGDGTTSTVISPVHTYTSSGSYTISLSAMDAAGCTDSIKSIVTVNQTPVATFSAAITQSCSVPFVVTFTNSSTGATSYQWNFGDGSTVVSTNPIHTYTTSGTYTVTMSAINANGTCADSLKKNSYIIISPPIANFTALPDSGCIPLNVKFSSNSTSALDPIASYTWTYGDGNTATTTVPTSSNTYTASGIFSPTLIVQTTQGCQDTFVCKNCIRAGTPPVANLANPPDSVCFGSPVMFSDSSTGAIAWHWIFGDGASSPIQNPLHIFADTGIFHVKVVAYNNGCKDTSAGKTIIVLAPKALFKFTLSCITNSVVHFSSISAGADSLVWRFGDGSVDTSNNTHPVHTYTNLGAETVTLIAYNYKSLCADSMITSFVIAQPKAGFTVSDSSGCYPFTPLLTNTSQDAASYFWNFGDLSVLNDTSLLVNPTYTYTHPAKDIIKLVITDVNGCKDSISKRLKTLGPIPYFYSVPLKGCRPLNVLFKDSSKTDSTLANWNWSFGDGTSISSTSIDSIPHTYTVNGTYNIKMVVTDKNGCKDSLTKSNYIQVTFPTPAFTRDSFSCKGNLLTFNSTGTAIGPDYTWNFGDGTSIVTYNTSVQHTYSTDNLYTVSLSVKDTNGCVDSISHNVLILKPIANFTTSILSTNCGNALVAFTDSSKGGPITSWFWSFGDGVTAQQQNTSHNYLNPGTYNASLIVTNAGGCKDTLTENGIVVVPGPIGTFTYTPTKGCNPLTVFFTSTSLNSQGYTWDFGDGTVINGTDTITHTYTQFGGPYNPLLLLSLNQCQLNAVSQSGPITIINTVNVSLNHSLLVLAQDSSASINATSSGGLAPYTYSWSPTSGISCNTCANISVTGTGDTVKYTLVTFDKKGCEASTSLLIISDPCIDKARIPNIFTPNADGKNDAFYIPGICGDETFLLQIFDRWGVLLFSANQRNNVWDGRLNDGNDAPDGVYFFIVNVSGNTYKGFVHLIR